MMLTRMVRVAGKSSLLLALLRMLEKESGSVEIDDVDIDSISLHALRSSITVIPQDPMVAKHTHTSSMLGARVRNSSLVDVHRQRASEPGPVRATHGQGVVAGAVARVAGIAR